MLAVSNERTESTEHANFILARKADKTRELGQFAQLKVVVSSTLVSPN